MGMQHTPASMLSTVHSCCSAVPYHAAVAPLLLLTLLPLVLLLILIIVIMSNFTCSIGEVLLLFSLGSFVVKAAPRIISVHYLYAGQFAHVRDTMRKESLLAALTRDEVRTYSITCNTNNRATYAT